MVNNVIKFKCKEQISASYFIKKVWNNQFAVINILNGIAHSLHKDLTQARRVMSQLNHFSKVL